MRTRLENLDGLALCYEKGQSPAFLAGQAMDQAPVLRQAYLDTTTRQTVSRAELRPPPR